jgi:nucleotide-binding universal stress UspA family protein
MRLVVAPQSSTHVPIDETTRSVRGIETIVAFTDLSLYAAPAIRRAARLADQHRALLRVVHVIEPPLLAAREGWSSSADGRGRVAAAQSELAAQARSLSRRARPVVAQVLVGPVTETILGVADQADLLVLGSRGASPVRSMLLGGTAMRLLSRCARPMLVVKEDKADRYGRVLVPIDLEDDARTTLQAAQVFAPGAELHVLHAYRVEHEGALRRAGVSNEVLQKSRRDVRARVQSRLHSALARVEHGTHRFLPHLRHEHPVRLILATEARLRADLIVMSKRSRSKIESALLGSTTKRVLVDSRSDVLVLPPYAPTSGGFDSDQNQ